MATPEKQQFFKPEELERLRGQVDNDRYQELIKLSEYATVNRNLNNLEQVVEKSLDEKIAFLKGLEQEQKQEQIPKAIPALATAATGAGVATLSGADWVKSKISEFTDWIKEEFSKIFGDVKGFLQKILGFFGIKEKIKELASPEQQKEIKDKIKGTITEAFPDAKDKISENIDKLSPERLSELYKKHKEGGLKNPDEIATEVPELFETLKEYLDIENVKDQFHKAFKNKLEQEYYNGVALKPEQDSKLKELINEYLKPNNKNYGTILKVLENSRKNKSFTIGDAALILKDVSFGTGSFMFNLVKEGVLPPQAIATNFLDTATNTISLSFGFLGEFINIPMSGNDFLTYLNSLGENEKRLMVGMLYRKGGLVLNWLGSASAFATEMGIRAITATNFSATGAGINTLMGDYEKTSKYFEKLGGVLGVSDETNKMINSVGELTKNVGNNYKVLAILKEWKEGGDFAKLVKRINEIPGFGEIKAPDLPSLKNTLGERFAQNFAGKLESMQRDLGAVGNAFRTRNFVTFGIDATSYNLTKSLEKVLETQKLLLNGSMLNEFPKISALISYFKVQRMGDRMGLFLNPKDASYPENISKLNSLVKQSPELIKGLFGSLPYICVIGLSAKDKDGFLEGLQKNAPLFIPLVGPFLMMKDSGVRRGEGGFKVDNPIEAVLGGAFLGVDLYFITKEGGRYILKPVTDIVKFGKGALNIINIGGHIISPKEIGILEHVKALVNKVKVKFSKSARSPIVIAVTLAIVGIYIGYEYLTDEEDKEFIDKNGLLDIEKLKKYVTSNNLSDDEKESILQAIYPDYEDNIRVVSNKLLLTSKDLEIPGELLEALDLNLKNEIQKLDIA